MSDDAADEFVEIQVETDENVAHWEKVGARVTRAARPFPNNAFDFILHREEGLAPGEHGYVTAQEFIKSLEELGYKNLPLNMKIVDFSTVSPKSGDIVLFYHEKTLLTALYVSDDNQNGITFYMDDLIITATVDIIKQYYQQYTKYDNIRTRIWRKIES